MPLSSSTPSVASSLPARPATGASVSLASVSLRYPRARTIAVRDVSFDLAPGQIGCLLGPSGCGKTTLLRAIAGFSPLHAGEIRLDGRVVSDAAQHCLPPEQRRVGVVFQDYALFPHLRVSDNIAFGLTTLARSSREQRVRDMLTLVHLEDEAQRYPHQLSGGQQQRVALARALAPQPGLLLLDEPFSNLDVDLRERLGLEVRDILKQTGTTALLVTHDQHEAFAMADVIGVLNQGHLEQWATPYALYHEPATRFVADFVGEGCLLPGILVHDAPGASTCSHVEIELGQLSIRCHCVGDVDTVRRPNEAVDVLLRPDDVIHDDASPVTAVVERKAFRGADFLYTLRLASGHQLLALVPSHHDHAIGQPIGIRLEADHVVTFSRAPH